MNYNLELQHKRGKLHAIERINSLLDKNSFHEIQSGVTNLEECFNIKPKQYLYDGVITGYGYIEGKKVFIYSQDFTVIGGTLGKQHGLKIANVIKLAIQNRCPIIGINDSGGARIQEGVNSLAGYGEIFYYNTLASGYIPQISIIAGTCAGGAAYSPGLSDFIFVIDGISNLFITGPKVVKSVTGQQVTLEELGGSRMHSSTSGVSHFRCATEAECFQKVAALLRYIPHNYQADSYRMKQRMFHDNADTNNIENNVKMNGIDELMPENRRQIYDIRQVLNEIFDRESIFEIQEEFAPNMFIAFAKLNSITVGIVANNPYYLGILDCDASDKAARFVRYCDCYNIPVISFVDVPGFMPGLEQEEKGIIRHGAKLLYAYSEATTIKLTVIVRKAYGGAYIAMCSKHLGADFVYAWPYAEIAVMGAEGAIEILYSKDIKKMTEQEQQTFLEEKKVDYEESAMNAHEAVAQGYVDEILHPDETRERLISDIEMLKDKESLIHIQKKHGNIPL